MFKRIVLGWMAVLLVWGLGWARGAPISAEPLLVADEPPASGQREAAPGPGDAVPTPEAAKKPATKPKAKVAAGSGASAGQAANEEEPHFVPALLSVTAVKQHVGACQYWVMLRNRLPFRIRDLSLRFTAYVKDAGYSEPVPLETLTRSFFEVRPTDEQYLDLFFMNARCDSFTSIQIEDTGRCTVGETTKFSAQKGDCSRYVELEPSPLVPWMKGGALPDKMAPASAPAVRSGVSLVSKRDVERLVANFASAYEAGDLERFVSLFDEKVITDEGEGLEPVRAQYKTLFDSTRNRTLATENLNWRALTERTVEIQFRVRGDTDPGGFFGVNRYLGSVDMTGELREGNKLVITRFFQRKF